MGLKYKEIAQDIAQKIANQTFQKNCLANLN